MQVPKAMKQSTMEVCEAKTFSLVVLHVHACMWSHAETGVSTVRVKEALKCLAATIVRA